MAVTKKNVAKTAAAKTEESKTAAKVEAEGVEAAEKENTAEAAAKKETVKKETEKKAPAKKETASKAPAKKAAKEAEVSSTLHIQFGGKSYSEEKLLEIAKDVWVYDLEKKAEELVKVDLYVKPEEDAVYYVMNEELTGKFFI